VLGNDLRSLCDLKNISSVNVTRYVNSEVQITIRDSLRIPDVFWSDVPLRAVVLLRYNIHMAIST